MASGRSRALGLAVALWATALVMFVVTPARAQEPASASFWAPAGPSLASKLLVTWYGNPRTNLMGVLGKYDGHKRAAGLVRQAAAFVPLTIRTVVPAYEVIAVVAMDNPGSDNMWRRQESRDVLDQMLWEARLYGLKLILDVQPGQSTVQEELDYLRPYLEQPDVYLALDPEFNMWKGQQPGKQIGHMSAEEVNYSINLLERIVREKGLPPKVLIVHQFILSMLPDKEKIGDSPLVDVVLTMDGFGSQDVKLNSYRTVMERPLEFAGVKLFYEHDPDLLSPGQVLGLDPTPSVVIYQ